MSLIHRAPTIQTATIANGAATSSTVVMGNYGAYGIVLPAAFTGTSLTFKVSADNTTFQPLYNASGQVSLTVAQGRSYSLPSDLTFWPYWQVVSGSTEAGARTLLIIGSS